MSTPTSIPSARQADPHDLKVDTGSDRAAASGRAALDPSTPVPGAAEKQERICDAPSDPHKPAGVESVDKGA